ncbi:MAG: hypothetical protein IPM29_27980 [Planctomycetes bacterium]|nr:hypothetical protein [Planctomycetota bacterium]
MADSGGIDRLPSLTGLGRAGSTRQQRRRARDEFRRELDGDEGGEHGGDPAAETPMPRPRGLQSEGSDDRRDERDGTSHVDIVV